MNNRFALALSLALCALSLTATAHADAFLKIDGIQGEATDAGHKDEVVIDSFSFGNQSSASFTAGGANVAKVQFDAFTFTHVTDKASAPLLLAAAKGTAIRTVVLSVRKPGPGGTMNEYLKVTLSNVLVTSVQVSGSGTEVPREQITLRFTKILFEYSATSRDGKVSPAGKMSWDAATGKEP